MNKKEFATIIQKLNFDFSQINPEGKAASRKINKELFTKFNEVYPNVCQGVAEFVYLSLHYKEDSFIDSHFCKICGKSVEFIPDKKKYRDYCSYECMNKDQKNIQKKREHTNLKKYGCKSAASTEETKKKIQNTFIEKYGCKAPISQNKDVRKKQSKLV